MSIKRSELSTQHYEYVATGRRLGAVHPPHVLLTEIIDPLGITRYRVAKSMGVQQRRIAEICSGERVVNADTAMSLGLAFGVDPQLWLNLRAQYDIDTIEREHGARLAKEVRPIAA